MSKLEAEKVKALLEKATPGKWLADNDGSHSGFVYALNDDGYNRMTLSVQRGHEYGRTRTASEEVHANAELIGLLPDLARAYLALTAERDALRAKVARFEKLAADYKGFADKWRDIDLDVSAEFEGQANELLALIAPTEASQ